jgi:hypothetical protein
MEKKLAGSPPPTTDTFESIYAFSVSMGLERETNNHLEQSD